MILECVHLFQICQPLMAWVPALTGDIDRKAVALILYAKIVELPVDKIRNCVAIIFVHDILDVF